MSARDIYESSIRQLPAIERLRLATLILDDLTAAGGEGLDISDSWSDQDVADLAAYSMKCAEQSVPPGDDHA